MDNKKLNMSDLERDMASVETDAIVEEQYNADRNYTTLDNELKNIISRIPYPKTDKYTTGIDYEDIDRIKYEKNSNQPYWEKRDKVKMYCDNGSLYSGHLNVYNTDYYIMDSRVLDTKILKVNDNEIWLINVDDRYYSDFVKWWRYPSENPSVRFSRNITMHSRTVSDVDIILDKGNELFSNISDAYLRKALIRNKDKSGVQSIIQTIQKKQDNIRSLPKEKSFIVQGCAGSGKTMVLLHRLRYLLYNKDIYSNEYLFLVPSNNFKEFIDEISNNFNINQKNILSYQEYYQDLIGKKAKSQVGDTSELVFSPNYLKRIYSKSFMQEAYKTIFDTFLNQTNQLIEICDGKLNELIDFEKLTLEDSIDGVKNKAIKNSEDLTKEIQAYTQIKIDNNYDNIQHLIAEVEDAYIARKQEYELAVNPDVEITILSDDIRLLNNEALNEIKKNIEAEKQAIAKASIFTTLAHKNKLKKLESSYDSLYEEVVSALIIEDKRKYAEQATQLVYVYGTITIADIEKKLSILKTILLESNETIAKTQNDLENIYDYLATKFKTEIENLNKLIALSSELSDEEYDLVKALNPSSSFFEENIRIGIDLLECFEEHITTQREKDIIKNELSLFANRTENQLYAYLNTLLFNVCKKKVATEFDLKICDAYKHYWYVALYCNYLTRPVRRSSKKYIFIDEAQDLSASEIELIYKINNIDEAPIINLFGDTNQMITTHGIEDWSSLEIILPIYTLEENFRNTNQVVEYCNSRLPIQMLKIGVDMEPVCEYKNIHEAINATNSVLERPVFIVKDDYFAADLKLLLGDTPINGFEIYTVKSAKGLEFKEVFVFDYQMTSNEKYISYTRALAKLNVIKELPEKANRKETLILQGVEQEESVTLDNAE